MSRADQLARFLADHWGRPYELGTWDCILFVAAWADILDGQGHVARLRGTYGTEAAGLARLAPHGINAAISETLGTCGWETVGPPYELGDIVLTDLGHPGVWDGTRILAQPARAAGVLQIHPRHAISGMRRPEN